MKLLLAILAGIGVVFGIVPRCNGAVEIQIDKSIDNNEQEILYRGRQEKNGGCLVTVTETYSGQVTSFDVLKHIQRHSPTGFQWGFGGSGPADLALSILVDFAHRTNQYIEAFRLYQGFKWDVIANIQGDLNITGKQIEQWLKNAKHKNF